MKTATRTDDVDKIWTVPDLAKHAGCGVNTIYTLIYDGKLKAFALNPGAKTRKNWRVRNSAWVAFMEGKALG